MDTVVVSWKQVFCWLRILKSERENSSSEESSTSYEQIMSTPVNSSCLRHEKIWPKKWP